MVLNRVKYVEIKNMSYTSVNTTYRIKKTTVKRVDSDNQDMIICIMADSGISFWGIISERCLSSITHMVVMKNMANNMKKAIPFI